MLKRCATVTQSCVVVVVVVVRRPLDACSPLAINPHRSEKTVYMRVVIIMIQHVHQHVRLNNSVLVMAGWKDNSISQIYIQCEGIIIMPLRNACCERSNANQVYNSSQCEAHRLEARSLRVVFIPKCEYSFYVLKLHYFLVV